LVPLDSVELVLLPDFGAQFFDIALLQHPAPALGAHFALALLVVEVSFWVLEVD
jgi:hypothetical protein